MKAAENALEALIGPFRLRNSVRAAVTKGMLMPFPVSMQKGKANARLEKGQNMREASDAAICFSVLSCFGCSVRVFEKRRRSGSPTQYRYPLQL